MNRAATPSLSIASVTVIALLLASGVVAVVCCRSLFADGAHHLLVMLTTGDIILAWPSQLFAEYLMDYPVVAAIELGVRSLRALTMLFTASLIYVPLVAYAAAIWIARDDRRLWTATTVVLTLCYYPTSFFLIGEFHLLYALFWLGFVIVLSGKGDHPAGALSLAFVGFLQIKSYDVSVVFCPILAILCAWRAVVVTDRRARLLLTLAVVLLMIAAWSGLQGVLHPADPTSRAGFFAETENILRDGLVRGEVGLVVLAVAAAFAPWRWLRLALGGVLAVCLTTRVIGLYLDHQLLAFGSPYDRRGKAFLLLVAIALVVLVLRCARRPRPDSRFAAWPMLLLLLWPVGATVFDTVDWARHLSVLCGELRSEGYPGPDFLVRPVVAKFLWGWTGPTMSVLLRPAGSGKIIMFHPPGEPSYEPFDPASGGPDITAFQIAGPICPVTEGR